MEAIKIDEMEFDIHYADGTDKHVEEGLLLEFQGNNIHAHIGTSRPETIFASVMALMEIIDAAGMMEAFKKCCEGKEYE